MPLDVSEYADLGRDATGQMLSAGLEPSIANQQVANGGASAQSAAFNAKTKFVRLHTDANCRIEFGDNPSATGASKRMAAGQTEYFGVQPGMKVACTTST